MAQAKKKKSKAASKNSPWVGVALYNLDEESERGQLVRSALADAGIAVRTIFPEKLGNQVGAIAGLTGFRQSKIPFTGKAPEEEFMLICGISGNELDQLLSALREANAQIDCKAMVTKFNRVWPIATLITEVAREHAAMNETSDHE